MIVTDRPKRRLQLQTPEMSARQFTAAQQALRLNDADLAALLGLSPSNPANGANAVRRMKRGAVTVSGPVACALQAMLDGWRPVWWQDPFRDR